LKITSSIQESSMPERDKKIDRPSSPKVSPRRDDSNISREPKVGRPRTDEESTPSRPHGTTEDPDRTL
jgi:hypothetical protein